MSPTGLTLADYPAAIAAAALALRQLDRTHEPARYRTLVGTLATLYAGYGRALDAASLPSAQPDNCGTSPRTSAWGEVA